MSGGKINSKSRNYYIFFAIIFWTLFSLGLQGCEPLGDDSFDDDDDDPCANLELIEGDWYNPDDQLMTVTLTEAEETCRADFLGTGAYFLGVFKGVDSPLERHGSGLEINKVLWVSGTTLWQRNYT